MEAGFQSPRIRVKEVAAILGCAVSTVWAWVKRGYLPQPYRIGSRFTYWLRSDIEAIAVNGEIHCDNRSISSDALHTESRY